MAVAAGVVVANLYSNQPLLAAIGQEFHASAASMGVIAMLTQAGYALGLLFFVPLGDAMERRRLVLLMAAFALLALIAIATAKSFLWLAAASLAVGAFSVVPQMLVPFAAFLSPPGQRGRAVGTVMSGLLIGILLARTVSGIVGAHLGWRAMYWVAAGLMVVIAIALRLNLPTSVPTTPMGYGRLLSSLAHLARTEPVLREAAFTGGMLFASFSAFWATLVFLLERPPYHLGEQAAGLFGLVGVVGASAAPLAGHMSDRMDPRTTVRLTIVIGIAAYLIFWLLGLHLAGLIAGVMLLDGAVQAGHVTNQARIYALGTERANRLNSVYMVTYFTGGGLGSWLGALAWQHWGWSGVCVVGGGALVLGLAEMAVVTTIPEAAEER